MRILICFPFLLVWSFHSAKSTTEFYPSCYPNTVSMCFKDSNRKSLDNRHSMPSHRKSKGKRKVDEVVLLHWPYNSTVYPSFAGDTSDVDASASLAELYPLVSTKCSPLIKVLLCSVHTPFCTQHGIVPPCRELCERVREDCRDIAEAFDIDWPVAFNCDAFPSYNPIFNCEPSSPNRNNLINADDAQDLQSLVSRRGPLMWSEVLLGDGKVCISNSSDDYVLLALNKLNECNKNSSTLPTLRNDVDFDISCPSSMTAPPGHNGYNFMGLPNCSAPCPNLYLNDYELWTVRYFVLVIAILCFIVTTFILTTFMIDTKRFRYPERPIIFYAFSYLIVTIVFLCGFALGERVACLPKIINENNDVLQGYTVVEGAEHQLCSIMFMILYYFTASGTIWWLILTVTWLLAAVFSWGSEAIEERHLYYHAAAWGIPALQTLLVFIANKFEGDNIAGLCLAGIHDSSALHLFVLLPMCTYLLIGMINLFLGFFYLNRVRKNLGADQRNKEKLAKFMLRIGVFSFLYILPQIALITIYAYEDSKRMFWEATWYVGTCLENSVPCPTANHPVGLLAKNPQHPQVILFCLKYLMTLVVALPPLFWVGSKKTFQSWKLFLTRSKTVNFNFKKPGLLRDIDRVPHLRDRQIKLEDKRFNSDPVFGEMRNAVHHGSSASVAAQIASKHSRSALQRQWNDLTDSETSYYSTSSTINSEMSRIIAMESKRNQGKRVVGRKGLSKSGDVRGFKNQNICNEMKPSASFPISGAKPIQSYPNTKTVLYSTKQYPNPNSPFQSSTPATSSNVFDRIQSSVTSRNDPGMMSPIGHTSGHSSNQLVKVNLCPVKKVSAVSSLNELPTRSEHPRSTFMSSTNISGTRETSEKPQLPPPPPPRIDSAKEQKNRIPERMLSI